MSSPTTDPGTVACVATVPVVLVTMGSGKTSPNCDYLQSATDGSLADVQLALAAGADLGAMDKDGDNALLRAARWNPDEDVCRFLIDAGLSLDATNHLGHRPLHGFSRTGKLALVRLALERGQSADPETRFGVTPLMGAAMDNHPAVVAALIAHGARADALDSYGSTALHRARGMHTIDLLLAAGATIDAADCDDLTPLMQVVCDGRIEECRRLLASGALVGALDKNQNTALHHAAMVVRLNEDRAEICVLLLDAGADPRAVNRTGESFTSIAGATPALADLYHAWTARRAMRGALAAGAAAAP